MEGLWCFNRSGDLSVRSNVLCSSGIHLALNPIFYNIFQKNLRYALLIWNLLVICPTTKPYSEVISSNPQLLVTEKCRWLSDGYHDYHEYCQVVGLGTQGLTIFARRGLMSCKPGVVITIFFFAKEEADCNLTPMKESLQPITVSFQQGLGQTFRQPSGTGIDFSTLEESELLKEGDMQIYPLAVKAEASPLGHNETNGGSPDTKPTNSQITQAVFEKKEKGEYQVRVVKQILWVNGMRYELQEIYGIGNSVDSDFDGNDPGKECVICLSEPRDTTVLPCRHMCMCSGCAKVLRFQTNRCPICRQPVERLLEIKVNKPDE
ncbi:hypothetical protein IFM89_004747 [Coptis chinensis]|uniref:RING-type E3 ubiquitin transferase n=1 Tax=Coptis chinensis TaxID=261450 RepID=A0A835LLE8_9MAGN|nr:hypothetical protein IFM89_004747 [Coptis chinensis]